MYMVVNACITRVYVGAYTANKGCVPGVQRVYKGCIHRVYTMMDIHTKIIVYIHDLLLRLTTAAAGEVYKGCV